MAFIESSSPSYLLMSSLDLAVDIYETKGKELMDELLMNIESFKDKIKRRISGRKEIMRYTPLIFEAVYSIL